MALPPFASLSVKKGTQYRLDDGSLYEVLACTKSPNGGQEVLYKIIGGNRDNTCEYTLKAYEFKKEIWEKSTELRESKGHKQNDPPAPEPPAPIQNDPPTPVPPAPIQNDPPAPIQNDPPAKKRGPFDFLDDIYDAVASLFN